jgi:dihydroorotase
MTDSIIIEVPDDFHHHLRDGEVLPDVVEHASRTFGNVLCMPNIKPPVRSVEEAAAYRDRIVEAGNSRGCHVPNLLMTLYLTDTTTPDDIQQVKDSGFVKALKLYPAGATTNSEFGVTSYEKIQPVLRAMAEAKIPLLVHGEVTDPAVDIFDREAVFIETILKPIIENNPNLKVVMEHITTKQAVDFVKESGAKVAATITAHHLLYNRNSLFKGGICPHMYCLPILKREEHRMALVEAATSGSPKFFLGTDSAPHAVGSKESACGCAGIFTGHAPLELYAEVFDSQGKLHLLESFASINGKSFYENVPPASSQRKVKLVRQEWTVPANYEFGGQKVRPLRAGEKMQWRLVE